MMQHYAIQQETRNLQQTMRGLQTPSLAPLASIPMLQNPLGGAVSGTVTPTPSYTPAPVVYAAPPIAYAHTPTSSYVPRETMHDTTQATYARSSLLTFYTNTGLVRAMM